MAKKPLKPPVSELMYRGSFLTRAWHRFFDRLFAYMEKLDGVEVQDSISIFDTKQSVTINDIKELKDYIACTLGESQVRSDLMEQEGRKRSNRAYFFSLTAA